MSNGFGRILNSCIDLVQARVASPCLLCAARSRGDLLCPACAADLPRLAAPACPRCARPGVAGPCGNCLKDPPAFERTEAVFEYAFPLDTLIQHLKYGGTLAIAGWFGDRLADRIAARPQADWPDRLLSMPLHPRRLSERGFNQAALIAERLARRLGRPHTPRSARRMRDTPPQVGLGQAERRRNPRGAFECDASLSGQRIALIDDVMTTGASLDSLARAALAAGAVSVEAWVVARAR